MRRLPAAILLIVFMFHSLAKLSYTAYFLAERNNIAEKYCVNKKKPAMHCQGCCHLASVLTSMDKNNAEKKNVPGAISQLRSIEWFKENAVLGLPISPMLSNVYNVAFSFSIPNVSLRVESPPPQV